MKPGLASATTRSASRQTYYTIRFLVDRQRVEDAYRAYGYFRWVDDVLDGDALAGTGSSPADSLSRAQFLLRQQSLLDRCLQGEVPRDVSPHEAMLVELVRRSDRADPRLEAYLRNMMLVMDFDVRRRGRLVTDAELTWYTRWLATAVTEAMHYFIGSRAVAPYNDLRYMAATGAHIVHMLRDTYADLQAGYFNVPREVLEAHAIETTDVRSAPYRAWVEGRVRLARACFAAGRAYLPRVPSRRHRLAALAYIGRFEWLTEVLEDEDFVLRTHYARRGRITSGLRIARDVVLSMSGVQTPSTPRTDSAAPWAGQP